ncbi:hypothetical protein [Cohnella rhizosphaerae]
MKAQQAGLPLPLNESDRIEHFADQDAQQADAEDVQEDRQHFA